MILSIIVAMDEKHAIGKNGGIPWYLPKDLKRFREITTGHTVIMGRKTFDSIIKRIKKPLPDRRNIIISNNREFSYEGCEFTGSFQEALKLAENDEKVFVIGGEQVYKLALPLADRMYITYISYRFEGCDAFFPEINFNDWVQGNSITYISKDFNNKYETRFVVYKRKRNGMSKVVDTRNARDREYGDILIDIEEKGKCPFCPVNFKYHKHPILKEEAGWFLTKCSWPYKNTKYHFLIISRAHKELFSDLSSNDFNSINTIVNWAIKKFDLRGGAIALRFGDTEYTGATVCHLHFHLIMPEDSNSVHFPIG